MDEAVLGIDGCSISSVPFDTSVGPPIFGPKREHIHPSGSFSPEVLAQLSEIEATLDEGLVPIPLVSCTVKDEPVKFSKNAEADIRIFAVCPAVFNLVCKQYLAPIKEFMRSNPFVCNSMVGINMSGNGGRLIRDRFATMGPAAADNVVEGDYKKMDKSIGGSLTWAVVETFGRMADRLGLNPDKVRLLVWACFHVIYSIHGDLFQVGGMNPSGCDITVEINAIANSLCHRAAFGAYHGIEVSLSDFHEGVRHPMKFADSNILVTYGDDFLLKHLIRMDLPRLFSFFPDFGMTVTDGQKLSRPVYRALRDVYFLKRRFFEVGEDVFCGLDEKSIYRMLLIRKPSSLSDRDHAAIVLEEAMREIFLNRAMDFDLWRARLRELAEDHDLAISGYLSLKTFAEYTADWVNGNFSTWQVTLVLRD